MSATAARTILTVNPADGTAEVDDGAGYVSHVLLSSLKRPELLRAAKVAFPDSNGKAWFSVPADAIREAVRSGVLPVGFDRRENKYAGPCHDCGNHVNIGEGSIIPNPDKADSRKKWLICCPIHGDVVPEPKGPEPITPKAEATPKAPKPTGDAFTDLVRAAVVDLIPEHAPGVDEETVRKVVIEALDAQPARKVQIVTPTATRDLPDAHHQVLPEVIQVLAAGVRNVFLVGPAGSGKSTIGEQAADGLDRGWTSLSFGPTTPTSKVFGYNDANGNHVRTPYRDAYEHGKVFIGDELDNGHPGLIAELNQSIANGYAAFADGVVECHPDFRFIGTGNTFGRGPDRLFVGRNILDAATLDRFVTIEVDVDERLEKSLALAYAPEDDKALTAAVGAWIDKVQRTRKAVLDNRLPLVVSPRATIDGAKLIVAGLDPKRVAEIRLHAGWSSEHRQKVGV